jgi:endonuclease/exonuclease/phosphatase family metal-dependent hydrolase
MTQLISSFSIQSHLFPSGRYICYVSQSIAQIHNDNLLLYSWEHESPPLSPSTSTNVAFRCGATDAFVPKKAEPPPSFVQEFTLATWNIQRFVISQNQKAIHEKAKMITRINADILALQEVGDLEQLQMLNALLPKENIYPYQILVKGNDSINVALLSKFPIQKIYTYRHHPITTTRGIRTYFQRDLLEAIVSIPPSFSMKIFITHLKSKQGGVPAICRNKKNYITEHLKENPNDCIAVVRDFNDTPQSKTIQIIEQNPYPLFDPLKIEGKENVPTEHSKRFGGQRLDYIFVSPPLMKHYIIQSARVISSQNNECPSDHNPIVVKFKVQ